jgi:hypothetical protein
MMMAMSDVCGQPIQQRSNDAVVASSAWLIMNCFADKNKNNN